MNPTSINAVRKPDARTTGFQGQRINIVPLPGIESGFQLAAFLDLKGLRKLRQLNLEESRLPNVPDAIIRS